MGVFFFRDPSPKLRISGVIMRFFLFCLMCFSLFGIVLPLQDVQAAQQEDDTVRLRSNILALDRIQRNILHSLKTNDSGEKVSSREKRELLVFVDYLKECNRHYCTQLAQEAGSATIADLPCPGQLPKLPGATARTTDEQLADLDRQLNASLGEFDEMLLKEQERIAAHQPRQGGAGGSTASGGAAGFGRQQGGQGKGSKSGVQGGRAGVAGRPAGTGVTASSPQGQARSGIVNGVGKDRLHADDDIVARQLREAAEKETDPELKEKLRQEYKKYKAGR